MSTRRTPRERKQDTLVRLEHDVDAWIATADPVAGLPHLVPLSFLWDACSLVISTPTNSPTSRNLRTTGRVRIGVGPTRDVVLIEGSVAVIDPVSDELAQAFAVKTGFDPRSLSTAYSYFRIGPERIQAWREADELIGRDLMSGGEWLI